MSTAMKSSFPKCFLISLLAPIALFSCGQPESSSGAYTEENIQQALMYKEIIEEEYKAVKEHLGLGLYDYFTVSHYRYNIKNIIKALEQERPEMDLSLLKEAKFPFVDHSWLLSDSTKTINSTDHFGRSITADRYSMLVQCDFSYLQEVFDQVSIVDNSDEIILIAIQDGLDELNEIIAPYHYYLVDDFAPYEKEKFHTVLLDPRKEEDMPAGAVGTTDVNVGGYALSTPFGYDATVNPHFEIHIKDSYWTKMFDISTFKSRSDFGVILKHELGHTLRLNDLYSKEGYSDNAYHPNTGNSIMFGLGDKQNGSNVYAERDKANLSYVYNGEYAAMIKETEARIRAKYSS